MQLLFQKKRFWIFELMTTKYDAMEVEMTKTKSELSDVKEAFRTSNSFFNDMQHDSEAMLRNVTDRCSKLEKVAEQLTKGKQNNVDKETKGKQNDADKETKGKQNNVDKESAKSKEKDRPSKHKLTWVGTSISKVLNKEKFEKETGVKLTAVKAYCVKEEGRYPKTNFQSIVPKILKENEVDTLVLETGSIEITNMDVNKAMMDPNKDIKDYKREWFAKAEETSTELFKVAEDVIAANENLREVIIKRLPRFEYK